MAVLLLGCTASWAQSPKQRHPGEKDGSGNVVRGKYIVEGLAVCGQCHTPRNSAGEYDRAKTLEGAPVWLQPAEPNSDWPLQAPRIAGTPPGTDDEMIKLLTTGMWRDGKPLRPPMPQFRMSHEDAQAVLAYLKSLSPKPR
jgi:mono/diheme cytochrome c family protein